MHTTSTAIVFSLVFAVLCTVLSLCPVVYLRSQEISALSVVCQAEDNCTSSIYSVHFQNSENNDWNVAESCPEKAYRFSRGVRDSVKILIG